MLVLYEKTVNDSIQQNSESGDYMSLSEEEKLLIATVCGESIGEGNVAWQAVTNVIMNRISSKHFPDTVTEIIQ